MFDVIFFLRIQMKRNINLKVGNYFRTAKWVGLTGGWWNKILHPILSSSEFVLSCVLRFTLEKPVITLPLPPVSLWEEPAEAVTELLSKARNKLQWKQTKDLITAFEWKQESRPWNWNLILVKFWKETGKRIQEVKLDGFWAFGKQKPRFCPSIPWSLWKLTYISRSLGKDLEPMPSLSC